MSRISAPQRRELLIGAALRVLSRDGLAAATTRAIVAEAGMSLASFHYVFVSRDELLREVIAHVVAGEGDVAFLSLLDEPHDIHTAIRRGLEAYFLLVRDDPGREQAMFELTQHALRTPDLAGLPAQQYARYHEVAAELLRIAARRTGDSWRAPVDDLARFVVVLTDGITLAWLADRDDAAAQRSLALAAHALVAHASSSISA